MSDKQAHAKFYDPLTERWHTMSGPPVTERSKPPNMAEEHAAKIMSNLRIAQHAHVWQAIEATATATQMSGACPDGSRSDESES